MARPQITPKSAQPNAPRSTPRVNGVCRESAKSVKEADAKRLLKKREREIADGKLPGIYFDKVRFDELAEDFIKVYEINNRKTVNRAELAIGQLKKAFEGARVTDIVTPEMRKYIEMRIDAGAANATCSTEAASLPGFAEGHHYWHNGRFCK
jgi:hypothetical protein